MAFAIVCALGAVACGGAGSGDNGDEQDVASSAARFETFTGIDGQTYFHLVAGNGELVLQSEGYKQADGATAGIAAVKNNGSHADMYEVRQAEDGTSYFVLKAANGQIVATSEMYANTSNAERGASDVRALVTKITRWEAVAVLPKASFAAFKGIDGQYYFNLRAKNGEIVLQSEGYASKQMAVKGIASVRANGASDSMFSVFGAADGTFAFHLQATNGQVIGSSEIYFSKSNADRTVKEIIADLGTNVPGPDQD
jgi:uncharacterized protein YegP (UPF0339 family)